MNDRKPQARSENLVAAVPTTSGKRRRLITAAGGGVGVLLSVSAKTALGSTICQSPSAMISGNMSHRPGDDKSCVGGLSPGFWVQPQKSGYWSTAWVSFPTFKEPIVECAPGMGSLSLSVIQDPGTLIDSVFDGGTAGFQPGVGELPDPGLWAVLFRPKRFGPNGQLLRHLTAAWLNAGYFGNDYPVSRAQIQKMWSDLRLGGTYCPSSIDCGALGWDAQQVQSYIDGMYDDNGLDMPNYCLVSQNP